MSKCKVYDEKILVGVIRNGIAMEVMFSEIKAGDKVCDSGYQFHVGTDAHFSGDSTYDGWLLYDVAGNDYYPEDFGAELVYDPDEDPCENETES